MSRLRVLTIGSSPSSLFLSWRLAASQSCSVSIAWQNIKSKKTSISISSDIFGATNNFIPDSCYDYNSLEIIGDTPSSPFDVILLSLSSLRQLNKIQKHIQKLITPGHTLILLDSSRCPPIQNYVKSKFANNQVICVISESNIYKIPPASDSERYYHSSFNRSNKVYLEPPTQDQYELRTSSLIRNLIVSLQTSGLDPITLSHNQYLVLQWKRSIPLIAFEPLSIMLDINDPVKLIQSVVAKPIYEGLINELLLISKQQIGADIGSIDDFINPQCIQSLSTKVLTSVSPTFPFQSSINMYYDFFYQFPIPIDVILLHPILLSDELNLSSTPYLECIFAFMTQLTKLNDNENSTSLATSLFQRNLPTPSESHSPSSSNTGSSHSLLTTAIDAKSVSNSSINSLKLREEALIKREQAVLSREQALNDSRDPYQTSYQQQPPPPNRRASVNTVNNYPLRLPSIPNNLSNLPNNQYQMRQKSSPKRSDTLTTIANTNLQYQPQTAKEIDMMNLTARRSRRSIGNTYNSDLSLNRMGSSMGYHRMSSPALSSLNQPFSQQLDLNDVATGNDRYGNVANKPAATVKRLSSTIFRSKSRSNSISSQAAFQLSQPNGYTNGYISNSTFQLNENSSSNPSSSNPSTSSNPSSSNPSPATQPLSNPSINNSSNPYINSIGSNPYANPSPSPYTNGVANLNGMTNGTVNGNLHVHGK